MVVHLHLELHLRSICILTLACTHTLFLRYGQEREAKKVIRKEVIALEDKAKSTPRVTMEKVLRFTMDLRRRKLRSVSSQSSEGNRDWRSLRWLERHEDETLRRRGWEEEERTLPRAPSTTAEAIAQQTP